MFCKVFPISKNCAYNFFENNNKDVYIQICDMSQFDEENKYIKPIDTRKILFKNINVSKRRQLNNKEYPMEYYHVPKY